MTMRSCIVLVMFMLPIAAWGQVMSDPTRPPFEVGEGGDLTENPVSVVKAKGLLSVIIASDRCAAIIDGKMIKLGENYADAILVEVNAQGVVLQSARGLHSMELFPEVGLKVTTEPSPSLKNVSCKLGNQKFEHQVAGSKLPRQTGQKEQR